MFLTADSEQFKVEIKRSDFLCTVRKVATEEQAKNFISAVKKQYFDATHNCYAYIVIEDGVERVRYSDDGEPQGTAGLPILNVLKNKGFYNVVAVVTRYFGGVKLGAGGLVRAYSEACAGACDIAKVYKCVLCSRVKIDFTYENYKKFNAFKITECHKQEGIEYGERVSVSLLIQKEECDLFISRFEDFYNKKQPIERLNDIWCEFDL